jgi:hypothetical protein
MGGDSGVLGLRTDCPVSGGERGKDAFGRDLVPSPFSSTHHARSKSLSLT